MKKIRIDDWLVEHEYMDNKDEAMRFIMAGKVFNDSERFHSPAERINPETAAIRVKGLNKKYVSRGGYKLEKAIETFGLNLQDKIHLDIGSSTGGFTDCALQNGVKHSYALDVGTNQLAYQLRTDDRVTVMERTNFRFVKADDFPIRPNFVSIDVSFISLNMIFPKLKEVIAEDSDIVALIKPQFEAPRELVGDKGVITDINVQQQAIKDVLDYAGTNHLFPVDLTFSPIQGASGNTEFLLHLTNRESSKMLQNQDIVRIFQ